MKFQALIILLPALVLSACSGGSHVNPELASSLSTDDLCKKITGNRELYNTSQRDLVLTGASYKKSMNFALAELSKRGFSDYDLEYIENGSLSDNMSEAAKACVKMPSK